MKGLPWVPVAGKPGVFAVPGVPAIDHIARGWWHPGPADTCSKCEDRK